MALGAKEAAAVAGELAQVIERLYGPLPLSVKYRAVHLAMDSIDRWEQDTK